jgi:hypothetical protein
LIAGAFGKNQKGGDHNAKVVSNLPSSLRKLDIDSADNDGNSFLTGPMFFCSSTAMVNSSRPRSVLIALRRIDSGSLTIFALSDFI